MSARARAPPGPTPAPAARERQAASEERAITSREQTGTVVRLVRADPEAPGIWLSISRAPRAAFASEADAFNLARGELGRNIWDSGLAVAAARHEPAREAPFLAL